MPHPFLPARLNHRSRFLGGLAALAALSAGPWLLAGCAWRSGAASTRVPTRIIRSRPSYALRRPEGVPPPSVVSAGLTVPQGFTAQILVSGLVTPRRIALAPAVGAAASGTYDLFVAESKANRIAILRVADGKVVTRAVFTRRVNQPYGLAFGHGSLYVGNTDRVVRFPYRPGDLKSAAAPKFVTALTAGGYNQHWTRNLLFNRAGTQLFVTVGSSCNTCEETDPQRAAISVLDPDGARKHVYASGMRNPIGLAWYPGTDMLWSVVNERDNLGDDVPPDYLTDVSQGQFYGWPYAYTDMAGRITPDPTFGPGNERLVASTTAPAVLLQAHSACLGLAFYPLQGGNFPADYHGDAFLTFHGSWNRSSKTGYKLVRVHFEKGKPVAITDFVLGFEAHNNVWGRPVDVQIAPDGSLLFSDDGGGKIWRITHTGR